MARNDRQFNRLTVDDAGDNQFLLLTIATVSIVSFSKDYLDDTARKVVLTFKETGDKEYVVNATSFHLLADRYSNDKANAFKAWVGKEVVLTKVATTTPEGESVASLWVARPKDWDTFVRTVVSEKKRGGRRR